MPAAFPADRTLITPALVRLREGGEIDPNTFTRWQREGRVEKLRNGLYLNSGAKLRGPTSTYAIANALCGPSYVSLHAALRYWGLIPEVVYEITSVTTRTTRMIERGLTRFSYRTVSSKLFFGFEMVEWEHDNYRLAYPEKALIDYAYFHPEMENMDYVFEMRFDDAFLVEELNWNRMRGYLTQIGSPALDRRMAVLREYASTLETPVWV